MPPLRAVRADQQTDELDAAAMKQIADITKAVDDQVADILRNNSAAAAEVVEREDTELRAKIKVAIKKLSTGLLEREVEVRLMLLAALCGEHLLLLGPPGTAKSELARRLSSLCQGKYFERLLTRFSVPEELFGPLSMKGLENDLYVRQTEGYLPTAEVAFIDEIFKANSAILNALLTLLNERLFDNGNERLEAPLMCLLGASNELPESEELDALYDRFLIRRSVSQVSNAQVHRLARLAAGRDRPAPSSNGNGAADDVAVSGAELDMDDFRTVAERAYAQVDVPDSVIDLLSAARVHLQDKTEPPIYVSDRRFMKAVQMLQVVAYGDGRLEVSEYDCLLLENVFGNRPDDSRRVRTFLLDTLASDPGLQQAELVLLGLFGRACRLLASADAAGELEDAREEAAALSDLLAARHAALVGALEGGFPDLCGSVWVSEAGAQAAVQALTPQLTENRKKAEDLLREGLVLRDCLQRGVSASMLERLLPKRFKQYTKGISGKA